VGQVIYNAVELGENLIVQLRDKVILFEKPEDILDDEENECYNDTIADLTTSECGMKLSINQYNHSTFKFFDKRCNKNAFTVHGNKIDCHDNKIVQLGGPSCPQDAANK
jgi:hypothetical protein